MAAVTAVPSLKLETGWAVIALSDAVIALLDAVIARNRCPRTLVDTFQDTKPGGDVL